MIFRELSPIGGMLVDLEPHADERGFFARAFDAAEFERRGLTPVVAQANVSYNRYRGTRRGFHYQRPPHAEAKLIRCVRGAAFAVLVDWRPESPSYLQHASVEITPENHTALYVPEGFAAGMQTLADDTELFYQVSTPYAPDFEHGLRHDDPAIGVSWPIPATIVSPKDSTWPLVEVRRR